MINSAMFVSRDRLNSFTNAMKMMCLRQDYRNDGYPVQLRNGLVVNVMYRPNPDDLLENETFHTPNWDKCWFMDGSSCTSSEFDIVRMGADILK